MFRFRRTTALVVAVVLGTTACSAAGELADEIGTAADELQSEVVEPPPAEDPARPTQPPGDGDAPAPPPPAEADSSAPGPGGQDPTDPPANQTPVNDGGGVGVNGPALLRADVPRLVIEIDAQQGAAPSQAAVDHLTAVTSSVVEKPGGISFVGGNTFASDRTEWSRDDLAAAAATHRTQFSGGDAVVIHVLYVRGGFVRDGQDTGALGVAYSASEFAIFPDRWAGLTTGLLGGSDAIERAVLVHEVGHLFGLVNLTYESPIDHEDPDHPGHSNNRSSVMFWAIESDAISQVFNGPPPDRFDDADRQDLEGLRSGRL